MPRTQVALRDYTTRLYPLSAPLYPLRSRPECSGPAPVPRAGHSLTPVGFGLIVAGGFTILDAGMGAPRSALVGSPTASIEDNRSDETAQTAHPDSAAHTTRLGTRLTSPAPLPRQHDPSRKAPSNNAQDE